MKCVIYVRENMQPSIYQQFNECARYAARYNFTIEHKIFDIRGDNFQQAVDKAVFDDDIQHLIVYSRKAVPYDLNDALFWLIYLHKFGVKLHFLN